MTFEEIVDQAIAMLQRRGRVAYRTLKRQFQLDDEALADLKTEIIKAQRLAVDEDGDVLVWTGGTTSPGVPAGGVTPAPRSYTPAHLAEKILLSKAALEGERKQVTVLFADLKASMELLADRDPEEARQLLDPVLERMMASVHHYEGTVNQVMEVVVRAIANDLHMDYSAIGQTTHLAARMEQLATPGSILLTAETLQLAEGFIQVKALGPVPVKGLAAPVEVCELVGASAIRRRLEAAVARGLTRFVGRQTELAALQHALEWVGEGHGQVVAVLGEAGVGKSRLVYELVHSHCLQGWLVLESASVSYGQATPYKHALTHEIAYGSLLQERRRARHARIVAATEQLYPDRMAEQVEWIAHHALRGGVWEKAVAYLHQAGAKARAHEARREAVAYLEQALLALQQLPTCQDTLAQAIDLRLNPRRLLFALGQLEGVFDHLHHAKILAEELADPRRLGRICSDLTHYFGNTGDPKRAIESGERALTLAAALEDVSLQASAHQRLGMSYEAMGEYRRATDTLKRAIAAEEQLSGDAAWPSYSINAVSSRTWLVWCLAAVGAFAEGDPLGKEAVRKAEAVDEPFTLINASFGVSRLYLCQGDLAKAIPLLERCLALCQMWDIPVPFPIVASQLGWAYALAGRVVEALPLLEQAVERAAAMRILCHQSLRTAWLSEAYLLAGCIDEARTLAPCALDLSRDHKERGNQAYALRLLGEIAANRAPPAVESAEEYYRQALSLAHELEMRPLQAHCLRALGTLSAKIRRPERARAALSTAIELYRAMEMTFWLPPAEAALAGVEGR